MDLSFAHLRTSAVQSTAWLGTPGYSRVLQGTPMVLQGTPMVLKKGTPGYSRVLQWYSRVLQGTPMVLQGTPMVLQYSHGLPMVHQSRMCHVPHSRQSTTGTACPLCAVRRCARLVHSPCMGIRMAGASVGFATLEAQRTYVCGYELITRFRC